MKNHTENDGVKDTMQEQDKAEKIHSNTEEANQELDTTSLDEVVGGFATKYSPGSPNQYHQRLPLGNNPNG